VLPVPVASPLRTGAGAHFISGASLAAMRGLRVVAIGLVALLVATACGPQMTDDEQAWCGEHPQQVVAASYTLGSPMLLSDALAEAEADIPSPEYLRSCRAAYRDS